MFRLELGRSDLTSFRVGLIRVLGDEDGDGDGEAVGRAGEGEIV